MSWLVYSEWIEEKNKCVCVYVDGWMDRQVCSYPDCFLYVFSLDYFIILITLI